MFDFAEFTITARTIWMAICAGLVGLAVSLLILARLRWIQSRPISTCVVLSVFAHILLIVTAYMTRIFEQPPGTSNSQGQSVRVTLTMEESREDSIEKRQHTSQPWNQLPTEQIVVPEPTVLAQLDPMPLLDEHGGTSTEATREPVPSLDRKLPNPVQSPTEPTAMSADIASAVELQNARLSQEPILPDPIEPIEIEEKVSPEPAPVVEPETVAQESNSERQRSIDSVNADQPSTLVHDHSDQLEATQSAPPAFQPPSTTSQVTRDQPAAPPVPSFRTDRRLVNGQPLPAPYRLRVAADRLTIIHQRGGNDDTELAVQRALQWLVRTQRSDGRWDPRGTGGGREGQVLGHDRGSAGIAADTGITGLAVLAFLGSGQTHLDGEHRRTVQRGLEFLIATQGADGNLAASARPYARMYCHGMATLAICEALAMTRDQRLEPFARRAVRHTVDSQDRRSGGWRYGPAQRGDTSQFGWQLMALKSAELAGLSVPAQTTIGMHEFLRSVSSGKFGGLAAYQRGAAPSRPMTAEALVCRMFLDPGTDRAVLSEAAEYIVQAPPGRGQANYYYWYYASLGLSQLGGDTWEYWNRAIQDSLLSTQRQQGPLAGSWEPNSVWGGYGGRVYSTALAALCLEVYYRYLPLHEGLARAPGRRLK